MSTKTVVKLPIIRFHENPSSHTQVVSCRQTDEAILTGAPQGYEYAQTHMRKIKLYLQK
jgi:hypothetical protein